MVRDVSLARVAWEQTGTVKTHPGDWNKWQAIIVRGKDLTPEQLIAQLDEESELCVDMILMGNVFVWGRYPFNSSMRTASAANLTKSFYQVYQETHPQHPLTEHSRVLLLDVSVTDVEGETVLVPPFRLLLQ